MKILLMRHGDAVRGEDLDDARHLSALGRSDAALVARAMAPRLIGTHIAHVVSSHLVRAVQTIEIVRRELAGAGLAIDAVSHAEPLFHPDGSARHAAQYLAKLAATHAPGAILCVCHEPIVRGIATQLTSRPSAPFATAGIVCIEDAAVRWALEPRSIAEAHG